MVCMMPIGRQVRSATSECRTSDKDTPGIQRAWGEQVASNNAPSSSSASELESRLLKAAGRALHTVHQQDLQNSKVLQKELKGLRLGDYFDERGTPRFKRMGLSFAAKQYKPTQDTFGSHAVHEDGKPVVDSKKGYNAKASYFAGVAKEKDATFVQERTDQLMSRMNYIDRNPVHDVQERRLKLFFFEIPGFEKCLPKNVNKKDLLPVEMGAEEEIAERRMSERIVAYFGDPCWIEGAQMEWLLNHNEVVQLSTAASLWLRASRGASLGWGMDRPSFCRFIVDVKLVDQKRAPFFWATSLFDSLVQPMRCCHPDAPCAPSAPVTRAVNRWAINSVFDALLRQHYDSTTKFQFMQRLGRAVKKHLPDNLAREFQDLLASQAAGNRKFAASPDSFLDRPPSSICETPVVETPLPTVELSPRSVFAVKANALPMFGVSIKPSDGPTSTAEIKREGRSRENLVQSMLIEPEVLHLAMQYLPLMRLVHSCYADKNGHMEFAAALQFFSDFRLTPELIASEYIRSAYEHACCTEDSKSSFGLQQYLAPRGSMLGSAVSAPTPPCAEPATIFGPGALMEIIFKAAFFRLGAYGNYAQRSSTSYARAVWLLTYLRSVVEHLHQSQERRQSSGEPSADGPLGKALDIAPPSLWSDPPLLSVPGSRATMIQPVPGIGVRKLKRRKATRQLVPQLKPSFFTTKAALRFAVKLRSKSSRKTTMGSENDHASPTAKSSRSKYGRKGSLRKRFEAFSSESSPKAINRRESEPSSFPETSDADVSPSASQSSDEDLKDESSPQPSPRRTTSHRTSVKTFTSQFTSTSPRSKSGDKDNEHWVLEDLFKAEGGQPCITDGACYVCGSPAIDGTWGSPACRGCSAVDGLPFEHHPFAKLLSSSSDYQPKVAKSRVQMVGLRPASLTPPPLPQEPLPPPPPDLEQEPPASVPERLDRRIVLQLSRFSSSQFDSSASCTAGSDAPKPPRSA